MGKASRKKMMHASVAVCVHATIMTEAQQKACDLATLRTLMERKNNWDGLGGTFGYLGDGEWSFTGCGLDVTTEELNALFRIAGITPSVIPVKGNCESCTHSTESRWYPPCGCCKRPSMSNFEPRMP